MDLFGTLLCLKGMEESNLLATHLNSLPTLCALKWYPNPEVGWAFPLRHWLYTARFLSFILNFPIFCFPQYLIFPSDLQTHKLQLWTACSSKETNNRMGKKQTLTATQEFVLGKVWLSSQPIFREKLLLFQMIEEEYIGLSQCWNGISA